jgi:hypothetical protein
MDAGRLAGYAAEMGWLMEILSWPVEWSALHGIAEIKTPILKIATCTDLTPRKKLIQCRGSSYPAEGANGLNFTYRLTPVALLTDSTAYRRGLKCALVSVSETSENDFETSDRSMSDR